MDLDPDLTWRQVDDSGFNTHIGPLMLAEPEDGRWFLALEVQPQHINMGGVCHGGVYMALADVGMGIAAHRSFGRLRCATIDFNAHFLAAAKLGQTLVCQSRANRIVSGLAFMTCDVTAGGRTCFSASGVWKKLSRQTPQRGE